MKQLRILLSILLTACALAVNAYASKGMYIPLDSFDRSLASLKQSVERLTVDNEAAQAKNDALKERLRHWAQQSNELDQHKELLNKEAFKLRGQDESRARKIAQLEKEALGVGSRLANVDQEIAALRASVGQTSMESSPTKSNDHEYEKLKLMKMIYDSQETQVQLQAEIFERQKHAPAGFAAQALAHQAMLKEEIQRLEHEATLVVVGDPVVNDSQGAWNESQLSQLEGELKILEQNHSQLKDLMAQMQHKAQRIGVMPTELTEQNKLETSINDLKMAGITLKEDLKDLRAKMVELDKRKALLEGMLKRP